MKPPEFLTAEDLAAYAKGNRVSRGGFGSWPAAVVIDFTGAFVDPQHSLAGRDEGAALAVRHTRRVADAMRSLGAQVIFTRPSPLTIANPAAGSISRKRIEEVRRALSQPRGNDLVSDLARRPNELILEKTGASAFFGTDLHKVLIYDRVDTLIVTGATTSGCVRATVIEAASYNYYVIVPEECVSDRSPTSHKMNLFEMDQKYADVVSCDEVVEYLGRLSAARLDLRTSEVAGTH